jgi:hypothetical protein
VTLFTLLPRLSHNFDGLVAFEARSQLKTCVKLFAPSVQDSRRCGSSATPKVQKLIGLGFDPLRIDFIGCITMQDYRSSALADADDFNYEFH